MNLLVAVSSLHSFAILFPVYVGDAQLVSVLTSGHLSHNSRDRTDGGRLVVHTQFCSSRFLMYASSSSISLQVNVKVVK